MSAFYRKWTVVVSERLCREFWLFFALVTLIARSSAVASRVYRVRSLDRGVGAPCRLCLYLVVSLLVDVVCVRRLCVVYPSSIVDFALVVLIHCCPPYVRVYRFLSRTNIVRYTHGEWYARKFKPPNCLNRHAGLGKSVGMAQSSQYSRDTVIHLISGG